MNQTRILIIRVVFYGLISLNEKILIDIIIFWKISFSHYMKSDTIRQLIKDLG